MPYIHKMSEKVEIGFGVRVKKKLVGGSLKMVDYDIESIFDKKKRQLKGGRK